MHIEVIDRLRSTLPTDDDHPYRSGAWRPNYVEYDAFDLDVTGTVPDDLVGVYLRNTENPVHEAIGTYHPFDGDGMLHSVHFHDGTADYRNRFVRTEGFEAEQVAGRSLWAGLAAAPEQSERTDGWGARGRMKDASSTDVVVHAGRALTSFYQCGDLYALSPVTLEQHGRETWDGKFPFVEGVSAHTKVDEDSGELLFFNYSTRAPYLHYGVVSRERELVHYVDVPLPGPRLPHDMAFTEQYAILNDCPMFWDPDLLERGHYAARFHPDMPTRFAIVPRRGGGAGECAGSRPIRRTSCTGSTRTRTATRSCSTASSRATRRRSTVTAVVRWSACSASSRSTGCRPGRTAGASTSRPVRRRRKTSPTRPWNSG